MPEACRRAVVATDSHLVVDKIQRPAGLAIMPRFIRPVIGDMLRSFIIPDFRIDVWWVPYAPPHQPVWMIGPQLIGMFIGIGYVLGRVY